MKYYLAVILIGLQIVKSNGSINYCRSRMCGHTNDHTFCKYKRGPSAACTGYMQAPLSTEDKARIMARLNRRRSDVALGLNDWPPAADMLKLRWVEELSREAQLWADQCSLPGNYEKHDSCRDLYSVSVGQCVASIVGEAPGLRPETMVDIWYMQRISYEGNFTFYMPSTTNNYGDFAQMIWSRTYMVGCGRSRFMALWRGRVRSVERLVCNFAPRGPVPSHALWTPGTPASMCPPRSKADPNLSGLCTYQNDVLEDIETNMTPEEHLLLNTVLEIENNETLNYMGSLDEHYLRKVAISTIDQPLVTTSYMNYLYKREVAEIMGIDGNNNESSVINLIEMNKTKILREPASLLNKVARKKLHIVGRPKSYNLEELEDTTTSMILKNEIDEETTEKKELYADFEYTDIEDINDITVTTSALQMKIPDATQQFVMEGQYTDYRASYENSTDVKQNSNMSIIFNVSNTLMNEISKNETDLDDYLSDPETFRQLQEALERMENSLAITATTVGKVRREIRTADENGHSLAKKKKITNIPPEALLAEIERNKTRDRGPMLSMVMKYLPYLQPYEKTILGEESANCVSRIMPSIILLLVFCM